MSKQVRAEPESKRDRNDNLCVVIGLLSVLVIVVAKAIAGRYAADSFDWLVSQIGWIQAVFAALGIGAVTFVLSKVAFFFYACDFSLAVTLRHYAGILWRARLIGLYTVLSWAAVGIILLAVAHFYDIQFPVDAFLFSALCLGFLSLGAHALSGYFAKKSLAVLEYSIVDRCYPGARTRKEAVTDVNRNLREMLLGLKGVDLICLSSIHCAHLLEDHEALRIIRNNNPDAHIYCMLQFPFAWHIRERAAELEYYHTREYVHRLVQGVANATRELKHKDLPANVRLRHYPASFRLAIWATRCKPSEQAQDLVLARETDLGLEDWSAVIETGGAFVQLYNPGQEGYLSPYVHIDSGDWRRAHLEILCWFFEEWEKTSPISWKQLKEHPQSQGMIARSMHFLRPKMVDKVERRGELWHYLSNDAKLVRFYADIATAMGVPG